jgi:hypothetical protein
MVASQAIVASAASWETGMACRLTDSGVVALLVLAAAAAWALPRLLQSPRIPHEAAR